MAIFRHATKELTVKIVYYGPGLCGKTTNLQVIYDKTSPKMRNEMAFLNTENDRTLYFDLLPMDIGTVNGFKTKLQIYTVPGQVFYNSTRKLVLRNADAVVFVADSQRDCMDLNRESLQNLYDNLKDCGMDPELVPVVFQWNKRDLPNACDVEELELSLNPNRLASVPAIASEGVGVFETLRAVTKVAIEDIRRKEFGPDGSHSGALRVEDLT
jgi:signal recognition particle receptor subunit beta